MDGNIFDTINTKSIQDHLVCILEENAVWFLFKIENSLITNHYGTQIFLFVCYWTM
jgi:hypothetical protein